MSDDKVFSERMDFIEDFNFGEKVASVFDDMLVRSVPFYVEMQRMAAEMARDFAVDGTSLYDLGCSTGTTLINMNRALGPRIKYVGVDYSKEMLVKCGAKLKEHGFQGEVDLRLGDLNKGVVIENASVVMMILTLQFIRPLYREKLMKSIADGVNENGCLILVEKVVGEDTLFNRLFIKYYYDMKRKNGYSELEIAQKREALENVLIPYKLFENRDLILNSGFRYCDVFFKWYNFMGMVAVK